MLCAVPFMLCFMYFQVWVGVILKYIIILLLFSIEASLICPFGPSHVFLEFRPYNSVAVYGPDQINADESNAVYSFNPHLSMSRRKKA